MLLSKCDIYNNVERTYFADVDVDVVVAAAVVAGAVVGPDCLAVG